MKKYTEEQLERAERLRELLGIAEEVLQEEDKKPPPESRPGTELLEPEEGNSSRPTVC